MKEKKVQDEERRARISRLIETEGLSQRQFALKIGENYGNFNKIMNGARSVPNSLPSKIVEIFSEVRLDWLLYGEGEVYEKDQHLVNQVALREHMEKLPTRPRLPRNMSEGHIEQYFGNGEKRKLCREKPIVAEFSDYDFSLIMKNARMSPKYIPGDELYFKKAKYPEWGNEFLVDNDDGPKFKKIYPDTMKDEKGETIEAVRCVSCDREKYPDFWIPMSIVHGFYRCVGMKRVL